MYSKYTFRYVPKIAEVRGQGVGNFPLKLLYRWKGRSKAQEKRWHWHCINVQSNTSNSRFVTKNDKGTFLLFTELKLWPKYTHKLRRMSTDFSLFRKIKLSDT